jgi:hypothetical protein
LNWWKNSLAWLATVLSVLKHEQWLGKSEKPPAPTRRDLDRARDADFHGWIEHIIGNDERNSPAANAQTHLHITVARASRP